MPQPWTARAPRRRSRFGGGDSRLRGRGEDSLSRGRGTGAKRQSGGIEPDPADAGGDRLPRGSPKGVIKKRIPSSFFSDFDGKRVLGFLDAANKANGANADLVLGQPDFTTKVANLTAKGMNGPTGLTLDSLGRLYVTDQNYNRVTRFSPDGTPTISIKGKKSTRGPNLTLRGTALSDLLVTMVQVKAKRGGFKNANGTSNWKYRLRGLDFGTTKVKVKATSLDGKTSLKTVRIRRR